MSGNNREKLIRTVDFCSKLKNIITSGGNNKKIENLCRNERRFLSEEKINNDNAKIALTTYRSYISDYRNAIKEMNIKNSKLDNELAKLKKSYSKKGSEYIAIIKMLEVAMPLLRENHKIALKMALGLENSFYTKIKRLKIESDAFYFMKPNEAIKANYKNHFNTAIDKKHNDIVEISKHQINELLNGLHTSDKWQDLAIWLGLATGRRAVEILKTAHFSKPINENYLLFSGQAKTKGSLNKRDNYIIPCLADAELIFNTLGKLRRKLADIGYNNKPFSELNNEEINLLTAKALNIRIKKLLNKERTFKDLRAIYALICKGIFFNPRKQTEQSFYADILGHSENDKATQLSYHGFILSDAEIIRDDIIKIARKTNNKKVSITDLESFDIEIINFKSKGRKINSIKRIHNYAKEQLVVNPDIIFSQSFFGSKFSRPAVKEWLKLVGITVN